jgi:hypothetical protein
MNDSLAHLLFTAREQREMYEEYQQRGSPKWVTGAELGDIAYLFQAAEPYVVPNLTHTVEFYSKLDVSRRRVPLERVVRDLRRLHEELTWRYRTGGGMGGPHTFSPLHLELQRERRWGTV